MSGIDFSGGLYLLDILTVFKTSFKLDLVFVRKKKGKLNKKYWELLFQELFKVVTTPNINFVL